MKKSHYLLSILFALFISTSISANPIKTFTLVVEESCYESFEGDEVYFSLSLHREDNQIVGYLYYDIFGDTAYMMFYGEDTGEEYLELELVETDEEGNPIGEDVSYTILKFNGDKVELNIGEIVYFEPIPCE